MTAPTPRWRPIDLAALGALLLFAAGRCLVPMDETDVFFNLRLGEIILAERRVPTTNLLSFTYPGARDVNLAWLFQLVLALAHRAGGIPATVVLKTAFVVATLALLFAAARRRGAHPAAAAAALALAAWAAEPRFVERPHLVTFLGLGYLTLAVERAEAGRPRALHALVPLGLVWANGNSCFFLAPAVLALYAAGALLDRRRADARRAGVLALALAPLVLATPSGVHALSYIANHWRMPSLRPLQEYRTASWPLDGPFFFVAAGVALAAAWPGRRWRHLLPAAALGLLGARRIRFVAELALLSGPILAATLTAIATALAARLGPRRPGVVAVSIVTAGLLGLTVTPRIAAVRRGEPWLDLGIEADLIPEPAIAFVDREGLRGRMYNDLEVGSFLTWQGWPDHRVFQDPRINGYPDELHAILRRDDLTRAAWQALLDRFDVTSALVTYPDLNPRAALFDPARWALVYRARDGLVFVRRGPAFAALIARAELPVTFARAPAGGVRPQPLDPAPAGAGDAMRGCEWHRRLGDAYVEAGDDLRAREAYRQARATPDCLDGAAWRASGLALGDAGLRLQDFDVAAAAYAGIDDPRAHRNRGLALLAAGRLEDALRELQLARAADPSDLAARMAEEIARERLGR